MVDRRCKKGTREGVVSKRTIFREKSRQKETKEEHDNRLKNEATRKRKMREKQNKQKHVHRRTREREMQRQRETKKERDERLKKDAERKRAARKSKKQHIQAETQSVKSTRQ